MIKQTLVVSLLAAYTAVANASCTNKCTYKEKHDPETCECVEACPGWNAADECVDRGSDYKTCQCTSGCSGKTCPEGTFLTPLECVCLDSEGNYRGNARSGAVKISTMAAAGIIGFYTLV